MFLKVITRDGQSIVIDEDNGWEVSDQGELDVLFENNSVRCTFARNQWISIERILEDGEEPPEPLAFGVAQESTSAGETVKVDLGPNPFPSGVLVDTEPLDVKWDQEKIIDT